MQAPERFDRGEHIEPAFGISACTLFLPLQEAFEEMQVLVYPEHLAREGVIVLDRPQQDSAGTQGLSRRLESARYIHLFPTGRIGEDIGPDEKSRLAGCLPPDDIGKKPAA